MRPELSVLLRKPHWVYFGRISDHKRTNKNGEVVKEIVYGKVDYRRAVALIEVDLCKRANPARTYLHELIHHYYPWPEAQVVQYERDLWNKLTQEERFKIYAKLFSRRFKGREDRPQSLSE